MTALNLDVFFADPWWLVLIKAVFALVFLLVMTLFTIWFERRVVGLMQHRKGPTMNGPFGLLQSLADGMKLMFKEDFTPRNAEKFVFMLAPFVMAIPAVTAIAVIPIAGVVEIPFTDITTPLQVTDLPVSVLLSWLSPRSACTGSCWPAGHPARPTLCWGRSAPAPR